VKGDEETMADFGIVSGDLIYVLTNCGQPLGTAEAPKSNSEPCTSLSSAMACSSESELVVHSDLNKMETGTCTVDERCVEAVVNNTDNGDRRMECGRTGPDVSEEEYLSASEKRDNFADMNHQKVAETGSTGELYSMSAEELQLVNRYLNEPMVIREATDHALPQTLVLAYSLVQPQTPDAAVLTVIDVLMSELGYQHRTVCASKLQISTHTHACAHEFY